jgi:hypothetical protein
MSKNRPVQFKCKIAKMGEDRIIWIPRALHEMIKPLESRELMITLE